MKGKRKFYCPMGAFKHYPGPRKVLRKGTKETQGWRKFNARIRDANKVLALRHRLEELQERGAL